MESNFCCDEEEVGLDDFADGDNPFLLRREEEEVGLDVFTDGDNPFLLRREEEEVGLERFCKFIVFEKNSSERLF